MEFTLLNFIIIKGWYDIVICEFKGFDVVSGLLDLTIERQFNYYGYKPIEFNIGEWTITIDILYFNLIKSLIKRYL